MVFVRASNKHPATYSIALVVCSFPANNKGLMVKVAVESYHGVTLPRCEAEATSQEAIEASMKENASIGLSKKENDDNFSFVSAGFETLMTQKFVLLENEKNNRSK
jgi:hypothetical protein